MGSIWPIFLVDDAGVARELGTVCALAPDHIAVRGGPARVAGVTEGIPYFLQDARPGGFLGRSIPTAFPELQLPARVQDWTDDHFLIYLTQRGSDHVGNLIVGSDSLDRHLAGLSGPAKIPADERRDRYPALARAALLGAPPGSSAQGEQPKFSVALSRGTATTHALVKFSPPKDTSLGMRWADLLVAEYIASTVLADHGIAAARNEIFEFGSQTFLQSERFDRRGADGRIGVVSLHAIDLALYGRLDGWSASARRLHADELLSAQDLETVRLADAFGQLIANTDRHFGNITLFDRYEGPFQLAPIYDMLPMLFAPQDGQLPARAFQPAGPTAASLSVWPKARDLAEVYWRTLCQEPRLSEGFRNLSNHCLEGVKRLERAVG